jgi:hypothetical protein
MDSQPVSLAADPCSRFAASFGDEVIPKVRQTATGLR